MSSRSAASNRASVPSVRSRDPSATDAPANNVASLELARQEFARKKYRVLLAHDLSGQSEIALVRAARLALERDGDLTILHVVDSELPTPGIEARRAWAKSCLESEVRRWLGRRKLPYHIDIGVGDPAGAIAARAQAHNVDLVVTGRHQRRAVANGCTGTVGRLLRQVQRPILVVGNSNQSPYRQVLIPVDFTDAAAAMIRSAAAFLPHARLHLLHASKKRLQDYVAAPSLPSGPYQERGKVSGLVEQSRKQALSWFIETLRLGERRPMATIGSGDALALVKQELALQKTDLLVLGTHARSGTGHASIGGAAEATLGSSRCDILFLSLHGAS
jgi:nucleotide-binding universal stress UspA family protein